MMTVTDRALDAIRSVAADPGQGLRIMVVAGGCSGLQYRMGLEAESQDDDEVMEFGDVRVFVDNASVMWLVGATLDFVDGERGAGFIFENPNAGAKCSCSGSGSGSGSNSGGSC
jgi:iron-sulfur cluster assembly protein